MGRNRALTPRQAEAGRLYETLGTFEGVARAMDMSAPAARSHVLRYWRNTGRTDLVPNGRGNRTVERVDELATKYSLLDERIRDLEQLIDAHAKQPHGIVEWRPDHRRVKDGGRSVRAQRREVGLPRHPKMA